MYLSGSFREKFSRISSFNFVAAFSWSRRFLGIKSFWFFTGLGLLFGSIPLLINLYAVFSQFGNSGLLALTSFASKKVGLSDLALLPSLPFYFSRLILFTFPVFLIILTGIRRARKYLSISRMSSLLTEINSLTVLFPMIYLLILSFMGTRHYHYLIPLTPFFSLNVARLGIVLNRRCFSFVMYFTGLLG